MRQSISIDEIKQRFPDEWILLGNPVVDEYQQEFLAGELLYHSKDKKEVCYLGKPIVADYQHTALFFNRVTQRPVHRVLLGPFKRISQ